MYLADIPVVALSPEIMETSNICSQLMSLFFPSTHVSSNC